MYTPAPYREDRHDVLADAIDEMQFAALITAHPNGYHATHAPVVVRREADALVLETHIARANPHWGALPLPSLAIFQGPHAYVSPTWYPSQQQHGRAVPTWNYIAVHAHGVLEVIDDRPRLAALLSDLSNANEAHRANPWRVSDAPADYIAKLSAAIVLLRMRIDRLEGAWKMDQRKSAADREGAMQALAASVSPNDRAVAEVMRRLEAAREP